MNVPVYTTSLLYSLLLGSPSTTDEPSTSPHYLPTRIVVDDPGVEQEGHDKFFVQPVLIQTRRIMFEQLDVPIVKDPADAKATVTILLTYEDFDNLVHRVQVSVEAQDQVHRLDTFQCEGVQNELIECVSEQLESVVPYLEVPAEESTVEPPAPEPVQDETPIPADTDRRYRPTVLGKGGIALLAIGASSAIGGGIMLALDTRYESDSLSPNEDGRNLTVPGGALVGIGAAGLIAGAVMLGIDVQRFKNPKSSRLSVSPLLTPDSTGLSLSGTF